MSEFVARIVAELDTSRIQSSINNLRNIPVALQNVTINNVALTRGATANIVSQIQQALNSNNFRLNVGTVNTQAAAANRMPVQRVAFRLDTSYYDAQVAKMQSKLNSLSFNPNATNLQTIRTELEDITTLIDTIRSGNSNNLVNDATRLQTALARARNELEMSSTAAKNLASNFQVQSFRSKLDSWLTKNSKAESQYGASIRQLRSELNALGQDVPVAQLKTFEERLKAIDNAASAAGLKGKTFGDQFKGAITSIGKYISASTIIYQAINGLKEMYKAVYDIDTAMVNLKKVTDETDSTYTAFLSRASESAQDLGRSVSSLVEQTADWAKLGYSLQESEELAKVSSIYANVGEVDDATAVSDLVTAMKAFNLTASDALGIVDSLNILGNNFATSSKDLGDGLSRSASSMATAGSDMYETLAMLTGGAEITQSASEFGNFLKISSMRIRGMKGELEELNEEVDESVDSISKVQTQILNLTHGQVNIFDESGSFRDYYDIMQDIASVFNELSSTEQASLSEILFGKQRGNQGAALLQAFQSGQIQKAYKDATNAQGSAMQEQERWEEGLEARTKKLEAAWQSLSQTVMSSDFLKNGVSFGTDILNVLDKIIDRVGVLPTLIAAINLGRVIKNFGITNVFALHGSDSMVA